MREIIGHKLNPAKPEPLRIVAADEPGSGGANHRYEIEGFDLGNNPSQFPQFVSKTCVVLLFQNGPVGEAGLNGLTHEALIAILIDRLQCLQKGPYPCVENEAALAHLAMAQSSLFARTASRIDRGVEGTNAT